LTERNPGTSLALFFTGCYGCLLAQSVLLLRAGKQFVAEPRRDDMERPRCYAEILAP